jgi:hypothetical protein
MLSVKWASFVERKSDFILFIIDESTLFINSIQKSPFQIQFVGLQKIPFSSSALKLWSCLLSSDVVLLVVQFEDRLEFCWFKPSQLPVSLEFFVLCSDSSAGKLFNVLYSSEQKKLVVFNNFTVTFSEQIVDLQRPITLNTKTVSFTTEIGNISNLFDECQDVIVAVYQTPLDSTIIISKCKI